MTYIESGIIAIMQIVLLSGGSGKRLWPLSNDVRSKQFLKLLEDENGNSQSMLQRVFGQIKKAQPKAKITIASNSSQVDSIKSQLGENIATVLEPVRRDTFPAIALACSYLASEGIDRNETVIVLPCDPYTEVKFFETLTKLDEIISSGKADMALIGIKPQIPTSKYGYIVPSETRDGYFGVSRFVEKPTEEKAKVLISEGAFWNGGVFAFKLGYVLDILGETDYKQTLESYSTLEKISFDYKVVEKAKNIAVVPFEGKWTDLGTWRTLADEVTARSSGPVIKEDAENCFVINELNIPIIALGLKDVVITACHDGILVSDLTKSSNLKNVVEKLETARPMYEERRWGEYTVLEQNAYSLTKHLHLLPGKGISLQTHKYRSEIWVITAGEGKFTLDDEVTQVKAGDVLKIEKGQRHKIEAITDLHITEVQLGEKFDETDIQRLDM